MRYCGRGFSSAEIHCILQIIEAHPTATRARLSRLVCEQLDWRRDDGRLKDMSCRVAMLRMQDDRLLHLPPPRNGNNNGKPYLRRTLWAEPAAPLRGRIAQATRRAPPRGRDRPPRLPPAQRVHRPLPLPGLSAASWRPTTVLRPGQSTHRRPPLLRRRRLENPAPRHLHRLDSPAATTAPPPGHQQRPFPHSPLGALPEPSRPPSWGWPHEGSHRTGTCTMATAPYCSKPSSSSPGSVEPATARQTGSLLGKTKGRGKLDVYNQALLPKKAIWVYPLVKNFRRVLCAG